MAQHIFPFESELQNNSQEAASSSQSLSPTVSEKLARYGSSALSGVEHLTLLVGKEDLALTLVRPLWFYQGFVPRFFSATASIPAAAQSRGGDGCFLHVYDCRE